ncbi:MAG TPA: carboxymuconolactone decarboxylase family protein [Acidimicrobiales bacterium]|nr:carboxymuconolactone decarboxylase family protein [Acidimicrobiales bacterium]
MDTRAVPLADLPDQVAGLLRDRGAAQINLYKALANSPAMVDAWRHFLWDLRDRCRSPRSHREIAILRTAVRSRSDYEWVHHVQMARSAGVSDEQIAAVKVWPRSEGVFNPEEELVLELADALVDGAVPDALVDRAVRWWGPETYVELVVTTSAYVMVPRVLDGLRVPLEAAVAGTRLDA